MNEEMIQRLNEEIAWLTDKLKDFEPTSKEYADGLLAIQRLSEIVSECRKVNSEIAIKNRQLDIEDEKLTNEFRIREQSKNDRLIDICVSVGTSLMTIIVPAAYKNRWFKNFLKFEETGSASSLLTRGFVSSLFRSK